jgi:sugar lactone lactonase YvrE
MLFPEGIAASADGTLYVGSITSSTVLQIDPPYDASDISEFSQGQLTRGSIGVFVDDAQGVLLVCDSNPGEPVASSLVALDLETGMRVAEHVLVPAAEMSPVLCNDGIVAEDGHTYFSDSFGARVMRVAANDLLVDGVDAEVFLEDPQLGAMGDPPFGANGVTELDGELYVVNFNQGTLMRLPRDPDGNALDLVPIALEDVDGRSVTLVGPDGLDASSAGTLMVVENGIFGGGAGNRLVEIELEGETGVVHEVAGGLDIPTTAAEAGGRQWVVEGQLDHLFGLDEAPPAPFQLVGVPWG